MSFDIESVCWWSLISHQQPTPFPKPAALLNTFICASKIYRIKLYSTVVQLCCLVASNRCLQLLLWLLYLSFIHRSIRAFTDSCAAFIYFWWKKIYVKFIFPAFRCNSFYIKYLGVFELNKLVFLTFLDNISWTGLFTTIYQGFEP